MNFPHSKLISSIIILSGFVFFISTFEKNIKAESVSQEKLNKQYPGEWFYNERAYPNNYINRNAISVF